MPQVGPAISEGRVIERRLCTERLIQALKVTVAGRLPADNITDREGRMQIERGDHRDGEARHLESDGAPASQADIGQFRQIVARYVLARPDEPDMLILVGEALAQHCQVPRSDLVPPIGAFTWMNAHHELQIVARFDAFNQSPKPLDLVAKRLFGRKRLFADGFEPVVVRGYLIEAAGERDEKPALLRQGESVVQTVDRPRT